MAGRANSALSATTQEVHTQVEQSPAANGSAGGNAERAGGRLSLEPDLFPYAHIDLFGPGQRPWSARPGTAVPREDQPRSVPRPVVGRTARLVGLGSAAAAAAGAASPRHLSDRTRSWRGTEGPSPAHDVGRGLNEILTVPSP